MPHRSDKRQIFPLTGSSKFSTLHVTYKLQCGIWHSAHIDDLRPADEGSPTIQQMQTASPGTLVKHAIEVPVAMETNDIVPTVVYDRLDVKVCNIVYT